MPGLRTLFTLLALMAGPASAQSPAAQFADGFESGALVVEVKDVSGSALDAVELRIGNTVVATTGPDGRASIATAASPTQMLKLSKDGFADQFKPYAVSRPGARGLLQVTMMARAASQVIANIEQGAIVTGPDGARLTLPTNALVGPGAAPVSGSVTISMTPVDVSGAEVGAFPGLFEGFASNGAPVSIASFGTVEYLITQAGQTLQLAPGKNATLEIPIYPMLREDGSAVAGGQTLPLWFLDETTGLWREEASAVVEASMQSPSGFIARGVVSHFSWWNLDVTQNPGFLRIRGFAPPGYAIAPNVDAFIAAVAVGGGPTRIASTTFPGDLRSLPMPVPPDLDIAIAVCTEVVRSPEVAGDVPVPACGDAIGRAGPGAVVNVDVPLALSGGEPEIIGQPQDQTAAVGRPALFGVGAFSPDGSLLRYQWRRGSNDITGATAANYTIPAAQATDSGARFSVVVSNDSGSVTSRAALLTVTPAPTPTISQPTGLVCSGNGVIPIVVTLANGSSADSVTLRFAQLGGESGLIGVDTTAPYEFDWNTASQPEGTYNLTPEASLGTDRFFGPVLQARVDRTPPTLGTRAPAPNSQVDAGAVVSFTLSDPLDVASVVDANVSLRVGGAEVAKALSIGNDGRTVFVAPAAPLIGTVEVGVSGVRDCGGNLLPDTSWTFEILPFAQLGQAVNGDEVGNGRFPALAYDGGGVPWVAYVQDENSVANDRVLVKRLENGTWVQKGLRLNTTQPSGILDGPGIAIDASGRAVVAYVQNESLVAKVRVRRFDGSQWVELGSAPLNVTPDRAAQAVELAIGTDDKPIAAWSEHGRIRVKRWNESSSSWDMLGPSEVAFSSRVGLAMRGSVPYLSWGEFHSQSGNAANFTVRAARHDVATNTFVSLLNDFRSTNSVDATSLAVPADDAPIVAHSNLPFVVSGAPTIQFIRVVQASGGSATELAANVQVDPAGKATVSDSELLGANYVVAFVEFVAGSVGVPANERIWVRTLSGGTFTSEPVTVTGASALSAPDLAANPSATNLVNGRLGIVFARSGGRIAFKKRD
jgi:hypothetical protein